MEHLSSTGGVWIFSGIAHVESNGQFQLFENFSLQSSVYRFCFRFCGINKLLPSSVLALFQMFNIVA